MRILIFGGSFDPPHRGHGALLLSAAKKINPRRILIIPSYHAPLKGLPSASAQDRLRMVELGLLKRLPKRWRKIARIDAQELRSRRTVYTVDTLKRLAKRHPGAELHFVVGADSAASFGSWKNTSALKTLCAWWTGPRPKVAAKIPPHFKRLKDPMPDISSTEIRSRLALGGDVSLSLSAPVLRYIHKRKLYGLTILSKLQKSLKPGRYEHTLAVAGLAERLALRWNLDAGKARLAGLLHDCGRAMSVSQMPRYALKRGLKAPLRSQIIARNPLLLHAYIGKDIARRRFKVRDPEILSAIQKHTLGGRRMAALDRLIYVADAASPDRVHPAAAKARALAFKNLDSAFALCAFTKIKRIESSDGWRHPLTLELWNALKKN